MGARVLRAYEQALREAERGEWNAGSTAAKDLLPYSARPDLVQASSRVLVSAEIPCDPT